MNWHWMIQSKAPSAPPPSPAPEASALDKIIVGDARQRWISQRARDYTPDGIDQILTGAFSGNLVYQYELFDLMEATWPRLMKDLGEIKDSVLSLDWTLQPWAPAAGKASPDAKRKAALVEELIWHMKPDPTADENDFDGTLRDLLDAWGKGLSILEVDWEKRFTGNAATIAPRATRWIHPRFYGYPADDTRLKLISREIASAALLYPTPPDHMAPPPTTEWTDFAENKFLIGVAKAKSGHPIGAALLRPLAFWWSASNFSANWLLNHAQLFGVPIRWATYDPQTPNIKAIISDMLENMGSAGWAAVPTGTQLQIIDAAKSAASNPNVQIIELANEICDILILRQTLTTSQGDRGSQALGNVHAGVRAGAIDAAAKWAARVINTQLIPAILRLNFGDDTEAPWFAPDHEEQKDEKALADRDKVLADMGLEFPEQWFRERHGVPPVEAGQPTIGGRSPAAKSFAGTPGDTIGETPIPPPPPAPEATPPPVSASAPPISEGQTPRDPNVSAAAADLQPLRTRLERILQIADPDIFRAKLTALRAELPQLLRNINADPELARTLEKQLAAAFCDGVAKWTGGQP